MPTPAAAEPVLPAAAPTASAPTFIDPKSLLLPKKETGPNIDSAQRINAGALLAAEQAAELPKTEVQTPVRLAAVVPAPAAGAAIGAVTPATPPEVSTVSPLQTYKSDIESVVSDKHVSVVSIATAEADRRASTTPAPTPAPGNSLGLSFAMIGTGIVLLLAAAGVLAYVFLRPAPSLPATQEPQAPFIVVDDAAAVSPVNGQTLMEALQGARKAARVSLGLVQWLYVTRGGTPLSATELLSELAPNNVPPELLRTLEPQFLLGVHSFDENQPFLILSVDSYSTASAGMLAWERTMQRDLSPLFVRTPSVTASTPAPIVATPIATSTATSSTSTASTTPEAYVPPEQPFIQSFVDKIVENRDTRAVLDSKGNLLLLWTMFGRNIILITTNEYTLREVVSRMNTAPLIPTPGQ